MLKFVFFQYYKIKSPAKLLFDSSRNGNGEKRCVTTQITAVEETAVNVTCRRGYKERLIQGYCKWI